MVKKILMYVLAAIVFVGCGNKEQSSTPAGKDYLQEGMNYLAQADVTKAVQSFDQAIRNDPTNVKNYLVLGQVYLRLESYDRAADTFSAATRIAPNDGDVYYFLALSRSFQGPEQQASAIEAAKKSAELFVQAQEKERFAQALMLVKSLTEKSQTSQNFTGR